MATLYELFKVPESASQEEIEAAYKKILKKANSLPQTEKLVEKVRRMKIAYGILSNPAKRKKYDMDLAAKRADELLQNVQTKPPEPDPAAEKISDFPPPKETAPEEKPPQYDEAHIQDVIDEQLHTMKKTASVHEMKERADRRREQQQQQRAVQQKQEKREQRKKRRQERKEEEYKREMEMQAYGQFWKEQGYQVKYPWTWRRVKSTLLSMAVVAIVLFVLWHIPFVKNALVELYNDNFIIKALVDLVVSLFQAIGGIFKSS